jgi:glycosyltransferase involved in cell wall biosynthesis
MVNTAHALENFHYCEVVDFSQKTPDELIAWKPDILHAFAIHPGTYEFLKEVKKKSDIPIVLSTVYLSLSQLFWAQGYIYTIFGANNKTGISNGDLFNMLKERVDIRRDIRNQIPYDEVLSLVDGWLPNCVGELYDIRNDFQVPVKPFKVVSNSVDLDFFRPSTYKDDEDIEYLRNLGDPFIVTVGRIEPRKNQVMLLEALKGLGHRPPVLFIGQNSDEYYYNMCKGVGGFMYLDHATHKKLQKIYELENCVYVLPSWLESPSLASMEALVSGCPIVVGNQGAEYEYFGNYATYVDPADCNSIRDGIKYAIENRREIRERNKSFAVHAQENHTWEVTARDTYNFYQDILK